MFFGVYKIKSIKSVGPHEFDALCIIFGGLLGDAFAETRSGSTRICFVQEKTNIHFLIWCHQFLANKAYTNPKLPKQLTIITNSKQQSTGKIIYYYKFNTYSFKSLNWILDIF